MSSVLKIFKGIGVFILVFLGFIVFFIISFLIGWSIIKIGYLKMAVMMSVILIGGIYYALKRSDR
jgi:hypothetical protein